jgi:hypothetical protein
MMLQRQCLRAQPSLAASKRSAVRSVVCSAGKDDESIVQRLAVPVATVLATGALLGAQMAAPEVAMAARSGGRVSSTAGFKARAPRAAPAPASRTAPAT